MIHQTSKYHPNSLSHFLALHTTTPKLMSSKIDMENSSNATQLDTISGNIGKSFTIAAILGLKKNAAAAAMEHHHNNHHLHHHHHQNSKDYTVMNLSINQQNMKNSINNSNFDNEHASHNVNSGNRLPIGSLGSHHHNASALQSLQQQLHQQHTGQNSIAFHNRERSKNGNYFLFKSNLYIFI